LLITLVLFMSLLTKKDACLNVYHVKWMRGVACMSSELHAHKIHECIFKDLFPNAVTVLFKRNTQRSLLHMVSMENKMIKLSSEPGYINN